MINGLEGFFVTSKKASPFRYTSLKLPENTSGYCNLLSAFSHTLLPSVIVMVLLVPLALCFSTNEASAGAFFVFVQYRYPIPASTIIIAAATRRRHQYRFIWNRLSAG